MRIAINAWSFPSNLTIQQGLRMAKRSGFDAVELNMSADNYLRPETPDRDVEALRAAADNMSIELSTLCSDLTFRYPLTSPDERIAEMSRGYVRRGLKVAALLGADTLLVVPGVVDAATPYDVAYERSLTALRELSEDAEREQVTIGVENVWNKFLLSPLEMRDFIDAIDTDRVQCYFDVGNVLISGYPEQWIRILGSRIGKLHVKDFSNAIGNGAGFANVLEGDVDWTAVRAALKDIGFDDTVTAEIPGYKTLPDLGLKHAGETMKRLFRAPRTAAADE